jgi:polyhydroxyalkanoate synthesis regulator phasin
MSGSATSISGPGGGAQGLEVGRIGGPAESGANGEGTQQSTFDTLRGQHPHPSENKQAGETKDAGGSQQQQLQQLEKEIQQLLRQLQQLEQGGQHNEARSGNGSGDQGQSQGPQSEGAGASGGRPQSASAAKGEASPQLIQELQQQLQQLQQQLGLALKQQQGA